MSKVVTFYSYKGGVGRTMALVNTAYALARQGLRILMMDLDLEAPGMTHFFSKQVREAGTTSKDALDLLLDIKRAGPPEATEMRFEAVSLAPFVIPILLPVGWSAESAKESNYLVGRLDLLPATLDPIPSPAPSRGYLERLSKLDLPRIFGPDGPGHQFGDAVRRHLQRARFDAPGDLAFTLREVVQASYDLILVDSRTGLNESSGLCIGPLSDTLVICTGLNEQNIDGTNFFMRQAGLFDQGKAKPYAVVVGPIPPWTREDTEARLDRIRTVLGVSELAARVPYHPRAALGEPIFVLDDNDEPIGIAYRELAGRISSLTKVRDGSFPASEGTGPGHLENHQVEVARCLSTVRLTRNTDRGTTYSLPFPTAAAIDGLRRDRYRDDPTKAVAVAVAALRLNSSVPFDRWRERGLGAEFGDHLLFMRLRLIDRLPLQQGERKWVSELLTQVPHSESHEVVRQYASAIGLKVRLHDKDGHPWRFVLRHVLRMFDPPFEELFLRGEPDFLEYVFHVKLPKAVRAKATRRFGDTQDYLGQFKKWMGRDPIGYMRDQLSPGLWPVPLMVSMVSLVKGAKAVDEIMKWIELCQQVHGYAWRVLVDWRQIAPIREHPKFQAFVKAEDERVAKIESAIDSGEYPL